MDVLQPLRVAQKIEADKQAAEQIEAARQAQVASESAIVGMSAVNVAADSVEAYPNTPASYLVAGVVGWSEASGNCVDEAKAYGKNQPGNPISWVPTTDQPFLGAAVLFYFNHVAIVVGIYDNEDVEVIQQNSPGAPHRYSPSEIRGYF